MIMTNDERIIQGYFWCHTLWDDDDVSIMKSFKCLLLCDE